MSAAAVASWLLPAGLLAHWGRVLVLAHRRAAPLQVLPPARLDAGRPPRVSVVVAFRNEMDRLLLPSLESMLAQDYPDFEVVAIDDHSTDESRRVAAALASACPALRVLAAGAGRRGKRAVIAQAARAATGAWLLFTDADILFQPDALAKGVSFAIGRRVHALSLLPTTLAFGFWEQVTLLATGWLAYEGCALRGCNDDESPVGLAAAGGYFLVERGAYEAVGGYESIEQNVLVDVALARRLRRFGFRYRYLGSGGCVSTRMYSSLREVWQGFGKNAFTAVGGRWPVALAAGLGLVLVTIGPWLAVIAGLAKGRPLSPAVLLGAAAVASMLAAQRRGARFMGTVPRPLRVLCSWLGGLLWAAILVQSGLHTNSRRGVRWKERFVPVAAPRTEGAE